MPHPAHFAINADDVPRARKFYERALGWKFSAWGPPGFYQIQTGDDEGPAVRGALQQRRHLIPGQPTIGYECTISVPSMFQPVKWLCTEPSEVSTNWSPATIGAVDEAFDSRNSTL